MAVARGAFSSLLVRGMEGGREGWKEKRKAKGRCVGEGKKKGGREEKRKAGGRCVGKGEERMLDKVVEFEENLLDEKCKKIFTI